MELQANGNNLEQWVRGARTEMRIETERSRIGGNMESEMRALHIL